MDNMDFEQFCKGWQLDASAHFGTNHAEPDEDLFHGIEKYYESEFQLDLADSLTFLGSDAKQDEEYTSDYSSSRTTITDLSSSDIRSTITQNTTPRSPDTRSPIIQSPSTSLRTARYPRYPQKTITTLLSKFRREYKSSGWTCVNPPYVKPQALARVKTRRQRQREFLAKVDMTTPSKSRIEVVIWV